jgi:hypothetical protein
VEHTSGQSGRDISGFEHVTEVGGCHANEGNSCDRKVKKGLLREWGSGDGATMVAGWCVRRVEKRSELM